MAGSTLRFDGTIIHAKARIIIIDAEIVYARNNGISYTDHGEKIKHVTTLWKAGYISEQGYKQFMLAEDLLFTPKILLNE